MQVPGFSGANVRLPRSFEDGRDTDASRFLGVDAFWALCMAINVYLAFFSGYTVEQLRALDLRYLVISYGASAVPAFVFLFVSTSQGPIYGDASIWCWISPEWDYLRGAIGYVIVW